MLRILVDENDAGGFETLFECEHSLYGDPQIFGAGRLNPFYRGQSEAARLGKLSLAEPQQAPGLRVSGSDRSLAVMCRQ